MNALLKSTLIAAAALVIALPSSAMEFNSTINSDQEVPTNSSSARGSGTYILNPDNTLSFELEYTGLSGSETGAHIHGPAGVGTNGGVQFALPLGDYKNGSVGPLSAQQIEWLNSGLFYTNIHSSNYGGGEIRGQITPAAVANEDGSWGGVKALF